MRPRADTAGDPRQQVPRVTNATCKARGGSTLGIDPSTRAGLGPPSPPGEAAAKPWTYGRHQALDLRPTRPAWPRVFPRSPGSGLQGPRLLGGVLRRPLTP